MDEIEKAIRLVEQARAVSTKGKNKMRTARNENKRTTRKNRRVEKNAKAKVAKMDAKFERWGRVVSGKKKSPSPKMSHRRTAKNRTPSPKDPIMDDETVEFYAEAQQLLLEADRILADNAIRIATRLREIEDSILISKDKHEVKAIKDEVKEMKRVLVRNNKQSDKVARMFEKIESPVGMATAITGARISNPTVFSDYVEKPPPYEHRQVPSYEDAMKSMYDRNDKNLDALTREDVLPELTDSDRRLAEEVLRSRMSASRQGEQKSSDPNYGRQLTMDEFNKSTARLKKVDEIGKKFKKRRTARKKKSRNQTKKNTSWRNFMTTKADEEFIITPKDQEEMDVELQEFIGAEEERRGSPWSPQLSPVNSLTGSPFGSPFNSDSDDKILQMYTGVFEEMSPTLQRLKKLQSKRKSFNEMMAVPPRAQTRKKTPTPLQTTGVFKGFIDEDELERLEEETEKKKKKRIRKNRGRSKSIGGKRTRKKR